MGHHSTTAEELSEYLLTPHIPTIEETLAHDQDKFPILAKLCKIYFVPATFFSLLWNTITQQQASLHPTHIDALIFSYANQDQKAKTVTVTVTTCSVSICKIFANKLQIVA